jgi:hypothetical protein
MKVHVASRMSRDCQQKYEANRNSWTTTKIFEDYRSQLDIKLDAKNHKILLVSGQCAANPKNAKFHSNIKVLFLPVNRASQLHSLKI